MSDKITFEKRRAMYDLAEAITVFRDIYPAMPISFVAVFLAVGNKPGQSPIYYAKELGMIRAPTTRTLLALSEKARSKQGGLGLLERVGIREDYRAVRYYLSPLGQEVWDKLEEVLVG